jgi:hypothetical protein
MWKKINSKILKKRRTNSFCRRDPASYVSWAFSKRFVKEGPKYGEELKKN